MTRTQQPRAKRSAIGWRGRATLSGVWRALVAIGSAGAALGTVHAIVNSRLLRRLPDRPDPVREPVSVLVPVRDEADNIADCLAGLAAQVGVADYEILMLDDSSTDDTAAIIRTTAAADPRIRLMTGAPLPAGWLGKPYACTQLAGAARGSVLVFIDADVRLSPHAVAAAVQFLRDERFDLVSPYPQQEAVTVAERLMQPLLQWSWLTTLPLRLAERSARPSMTVANGQFLAVDATAYTRSGGHAISPADVLDDLALARAVKRSGGRVTVANGFGVAKCRMYRSWPDLREGYTKSLWSATGSPVAAAAVVGSLALCYIAPPLAAVYGSRVGAVGYGMAITGRIVAARQTGGQVSDAWMHPLSIGLLSALMAQSWRGQRQGTLTWRSRRL